MASAKKRRRVAQRVAAAGVGAAAAAAGAAKAAAASRIGAAKAVADAGGSPGGAVDLARKGLQWLLGDEVTVDEFRSQTFERDALHVKRTGKGGPAYYSDFRSLATPEALFELLDRGEVPVYRLNMFRCRDGSTKETPDPPPGTAAEVRRLFAQGWSIQWLQPQQESDTLARFASVLESEFGSLVGVNAYLTPAGTQGLAPHWDDVEVFVLQLSGEKSWSLHRSTSASPLPPAAQTLPRVTSGDLPFASLSPAFSTPKLETGDLLYFPRGTIHYAPNKDSKRPSVHLTVSTYQRQTIFDLASKTFEEAMAELWEEDESLRRALPWGALSVATPAYPKLCADLAAHLRRLAEEVEAEAKEASAATSAGRPRQGPVASALAEIGADFVRHRMPPRIEAPGEEGAAEAIEMGHIVTPQSRLVLPDPSCITLLPVLGGEGDEEKLIFCTRNSRRNHMMNHPPGAEGSEGDSDGEDEEGEEEEDGDVGDQIVEHGGSGEDEEEEEEEEDDDDGDEDDGSLRVGRHAATTLRALSAASPLRPLAAKASAADDRGARPPAVPLADLFRSASIPKSAWSEVCSLLTQLAMEGVVQVVEEAIVASDNSAEGQRKRKRKVREA